MTRTPVVLVTGIGGQDGNWLARDLSARGWQVTGVLGPGAAGGADVAALNELPGVCLVQGDIADIPMAARLVADVAPDIVFHLAAVSSVAQSWANPSQTALVNGMASVALMEECSKLADARGRQIRFVNASSAEIFAGAEAVPQSEQTTLAPLSPYGAAKAFAHTMGRLFRTRGLGVSNAILYNHESPLRSTNFVTRKITAAVAAIAVGTQHSLRLGNLEARRDWGWAPDYVDCMIRMALYDEPDDFVVATGVSHSVGEFVGAAFRAAGIDDYDNFVQVDPTLYRPADSFELVGDSSKARTLLGWQPTKSFEQVVAAMVEADLALARAEGAPGESP